MEAISCVKFSQQSCQLLVMLIVWCTMSLVLFDMQDSLVPNGYVWKPTTGTDHVIGMKNVSASVIEVQQIQMYVLAGSESSNFKLFDLYEWLLADLTQVIFAIGVMLIAVLMMWWQNVQVLSLQRELQGVVDDKMTRKALLQEIQNTLNCQQSSFTNMSVKVAALNKRLDKVSGELDDENADLEKMEDYLNDWKENWKHQSAKLRQINTDNLLHPTNVCRSEVDMMIAQENQKIEGFVRYAGAEFGRIQRRLMDDHGAITSIFDSMEYIHDAMSDNNERSH